MLTFVVLSGLVALALAAPTRVGTPEYDSFWVSYKTTHDKQYTTSEDSLRRLIWEDNLKYIARHNLEADMGKHTFWLGTNEYADMTNREFRAMMNGLKMRSGNSSSSVFLSPSHVTYPSTVDWTTEGYVTDVKDQGQCGSCWAFSTTGSLEGQHFKKTGKLVSLSEQNLVDCSTKNNGCEGGLMDYAFAYIKSNDGIDTESSYPYEAKDMRCRFKQEYVGATVAGFTDIPRGDEDALMKAAATVGPISVAIDAGHQSFQLYRSGVYSEPRCSQTKLDHGVLVVGYGTEGGQDYWKVKNSWGTTWGVQGYIMMSRNRNNQCGIATQASYPIV
ncbi:cathepsin L-like [Tubulanus polymorphus]|uniref:cathepsin L-like n=1 Tax=Tubulanus polymorphus TaxID=672921 RepID=UPI003DA20928